MKKFFTTLLLSGSVFVQAQSSHLVISQVYGAGGNTSANYLYDFVELYNPTASPVSLAGWSLQYAGATSMNWNSNKVSLSGSVAPGKYFLIQLGNPGTEGRALPTPDLTSANISMSTASGKVALVNNTTTLTGNCPLPNTSIVDFVGWGSADCAETQVAIGPVTGNTTSSITRLNNGCTESDNNRNDFALLTASPRNSFSNGHTCNGTSISTGTVSSATYCVDANTGAVGTVAYSATGNFNNSVFKAMLSDAGGSFGYEIQVGSASVSATNPTGSIAINLPPNLPSGTGYKIRIEATNPSLQSVDASAAFEIINGAKNLLQNEFGAAANNTTLTLNWMNPANCFDEILIVAKESSAINGTPTGNGSAYVADLNFAGNGTPFDGGKVVYKGTTSGQTITNLTNGTTYFLKAYTRRGTYWSSGTEISDKPRIVPLAGELVIDQLSPQYNGTKDEYIQLVNVTGKALPLGDLTIDIKNATGANVVAGATLSGTIPPHGYWLILPLGKDTANVGQTVGIAPDNTMDLGFSNTNNQIGLIRKTDSAIIDAVGYGSFSVSKYVEGTPAANPPSKGGLKRTTSGADNNRNSTDFSGIIYNATELRNSNSRLANTGAIIDAGLYATMEVTGNSSLAGNATFAEKVVLTNGIFDLRDFNLTTAKTIGGAATKYIKTSGTGVLSIRNITTETLVCVGNSTYNPVTITSTEGLTWSVQITDAIKPAATMFDKDYAVQRTWNITPASTPTSGATLVFEYDENDAAQLGRKFDKTKSVQVWQYHNGVWQTVSAPQTPVKTASGRMSVIVNNVTTFSPFVIVNIEAPQAPLPVHFTDFNAHLQADGVRLQFTNALEKDVKAYEIERSVDGQLFQNLMTLTPLRNDGSAVNYEWLDAQPAPGKNWYRVKGVDEDGTLRFTPIIRISTEPATKSFFVYPNPVRAGQSIGWQATLPQGRYTITLYDATGAQRIVDEMQHTGGAVSRTLVVPVGLATGVYILQIRGTVGVQQQKLHIY